MIDGARLRQAREAARMTQAELAATLGMPQSILSRIELGGVLPSPEDGRRIADALETPLGFFFAAPTPLPEGSLGLFRALKSKVPAKETVAARRLAEIGFEAVLRLAEDQRLPAVRIPHLAGIPAEEAAGHARSALSLSPEEPIPHLTRTLERAGVVVLRLSGIDEHITGFAAWVGAGADERPLVVTRRPLGAFRQRWTLAHELGHLVFRHQVYAGPQRPEEKEANQLAAAFLLPEEPFRDDVGGARLTLELLATLKGKWGASMGAILLRAKGLGLVDEGSYRSLYETMRMRGYLKREPGDDRTPAEKPGLLPELMAMRRLREGPLALADHLTLGRRHVEALFGPEESELRLSALAAP